MLAAGFRPGRAIPAGADRAAGLRLAAGLRALGGTVAIPADPGLALMAGLPEVEDQFAAVDVLRASDPAAKAAFTRSVARAVATQRFSVIITEIDGDLRGFPAGPAPLLPPLPADAAGRHTTRPVPPRRAASPAGLGVAPRRPRVLRRVAARATGPRAGRATAQRNRVRREIRSLG